MSILAQLYSNPSDPSHPRNPFDEPEPEFAGDRYLVQAEEADPGQIAINFADTALEANLLNLYITHDDCRLLIRELLGLLNPPDWGTFRKFLGDEATLGSLPPEGEPRTAPAGLGETFEPAHPAERHAFDEGVSAALNAVLDFAAGTQGQQVAIRTAVYGARRKVYER